VLDNGIAVRTIAEEYRVPDEIVKDMESALTILESIHFAIGSEILRKEIVKVIKYLKHGLKLSVK